MEFKTFDVALKAVGIIVLVAVVLFILTWSGIVKCGSIPYWCDVYDSVIGPPRVLIVYGAEGLGDPEALKLVMQDPVTVGAKAVDLSDIDRVSLGNLRGYKLVIVEHAKQMNAEQLEMFMDYVNKYGGRLIWVGDAGTVRPEEEEDVLLDINAPVSSNNPWSRYKETETEYIPVLFDEFLGLRFVGNYCDLKKCQDITSPGNLVPESTGDHPLIYGSTPVLKFKVETGRDFSVVKQIPNAANSTIVMNVDFGSVLNTDTEKIGRNTPVIATSGLGERVAYYAYPPEYFVQDNNYYLFTKLMYYGMLGR